MGSAAAFCAPPLDLKALRRTHHGYETPWYSLTVEYVAAITHAHAGERLARFGHNEIKRRKPVSAFSLFVKQLANFFVIVLSFAAALAYAVSFLPGEEGRRLTALFILGIIALSVVLSFFQEFRAHKELEALDRLLGDYPK